MTFYLYFDLALGHWYLRHIDKGRWWQRNDSAADFRLCLNAPCLQLLLHSILTKICLQSLCYFCRSKCLACIQKCKMEISRQPSISFAPFVCKINQPCCYQLIHPLCIMLRGFSLVWFRAVQDLWTERANPSLALCRPALAVSLIDENFISGWWAGSPERLKL